MAGILDLFVPRERKFFDMLKDLSEKTHQGAELFLSFVTDYGSLDSAKRQVVVDELKGIEHECDAITHKIAIELNKTFLTPIDREDIHKLSTLIDDIMDIIYNIGHKLVLYKMQKLPKYVLELTNTVLECAVEVNFLVSKLSERHKVEPHLRKIHELEKRADSLRDEALAFLFSNSMPAVDIIKFKDIYEWLETVCDKAEDIADVVEGIAIKYA